MAVWCFVLCLVVIASDGVGSEDAAARSWSGTRDRPVVRVKDQGFIRGRKSMDDTYYEYLGIPYANASRENRFKSPLPIPTWHGIRDAIVEDIICPQFHQRGIVGVEDCLVLNVYIPERNGSELLPVMVYVHGGGFYRGSGSKSMLGPERFMSEDIILVTLNYRLSILGFLCTRDTANAGINDVMSAMKWVGANIEDFGGDAGKVTLFGQSAGAAVVELLMLSKETEGLIHRAITQSGFFAGSNSSWPLINKSEKQAFKIGKKLGYEGNNAEELTQVLRNASLVDLLETVKTLTQPWYEYPPIGPCVDSPMTKDAVVPYDPQAKLRSGDYNDIPFMLGVNKDEGMILYNAVREDPAFLDTVQKEFSLSLPKDLQSPLIPAENITELAMNFYFHGENLTNDNLAQAVEYFTDVGFTLDAVKTARLYVGSRRSSPVFFYEFAYDGGLGYLKKRFNLTEYPGVCHGDELGYLFTQHGDSSYRRDDESVAYMLVKLWTNFAKFGDPTTEINKVTPVKWEPADSKDLKYLLINSTIEMNQKPFENRVDFWDSIYNKC